MTRAKIAAILYRIKKTGQSLISIEGELFSVDELLTRFYGREVAEDEGQRFVTK